MNFATLECRDDAPAPRKEDAIGPEDRSRSIRSIDRGTVHQICSGQVITSLGTAVKELVENSVDAGASNIEIRLKDYGCELIEVIDNGDGVMQGDFQGLALKHHTSKLRNFSDLSEMQTFGFRGEALSSLCALGNVTITTRHKDAKVGSKLSLNHDGILVSQTPCPRDVGTTVSIQQLFLTLPVRQKEFLRNKKREFGKLCQILHAYGIINIDVRMTCTNQVGKGKKNIVLTTPGNSSMRENILSIFGTKQANSLVPFIQEEVTSDIAEEFGVVRETQTEGFSHFLVEGYVSSASHGSGRSCTDRQFFFINRRPCDVTKVSKLVNEVYHVFNRHQYPFVALSITSKMDTVDVNVTPDKRQIFLHQEKILLAILKSSLRAIFEKHASTLGVVMVAKRELESLEPQTHSCVEEKQNIGGYSVQPGSTPEVVEDFVQDGGSNQTNESRGLIISQGEITSLMVATECSVTKEDAMSEFDTLKGDNVCGGESMELDSSLPAPSMPSSVTSEAVKDLTGVNGRVGFTKLVSDCNLAKATIYASGRKQSPLKQRKLTDCFKEKTPLRIKSTGFGYPSDITTKHSSDWPGEERMPSVPHVDVEREQEEETPVFTSLADDLTTGDSALKSGQPKGSTWTPRKRLKTELLEETGRPLRTVPFDLNSIEQGWALRRRKCYAASTMASSFHARITPDQNQEAESELQCHVTKEMFGKMKIIGQFNLGFIIAQLGPDLFIIDQHATDEKYNFEKLQREQRLEGQRLITPKELELTASNEAVLLDNLEVFKLNGFDFTVNEDAIVGRRVSLVSQPVSKNWSFGTEDVEELIFMLSDAPGSLCRPSRVRQMFASRACRSSVMIGKPLTGNLMKRLVTHMGELEQPWNCPHGRPTMRHLISIGRIAR